MDVRLRVDIYPELPRPVTDDTKLEVAKVVLIIPWTVDVRLSDDIYPELPRPITEDTVLEVATVVLIIP